MAASASQSRAVQSRGSQSRSELLAAAAALAGHVDLDKTRQYLERYYQHVADEDLLLRTIRECLEFPGGKDDA